MPKNLSMPRLSDTMEQGTIVKWHVKPGQKVRSGDVIADIETDKATMELQTFDDGVVGGLVVPEGQATPVGAVILRWEGGEEPASVGAGKISAGASANGASSAAPHATETIRASVSTERVFASPLARKIAADSGIDLSSVTGSGPSGRIVRRDVEAVLVGSTTAHAPGTNGSHSAPASSSAAPIFKAKPLPERGVLTAAAAATSVPPIAALMMPNLASVLTRRSVPLSNMRRTIAARLVESKTTIPHYQVTVSARMDALLALRSQLNDQLASQGVKLSVNDFIVRASALAMHAHPYVNARWNPSKGSEAIEMLDQVNVGVAISLPINPDGSGGGLVVATLRNADQKGLRLISSETRALAEKARTKGLSVEEMSDSTFTISNLGMYGVDHFTAIINPPNDAILAVGAALEQPVVETGADGVKKLGIGTVMTMTMSSDHRIVDGAMAAQYLQTVKEMLEKPATLLV
jgi:pyruvate dehydrogenase E2 component (dihydrolipoamide acetyltransferase)